MHFLSPFPGRVVLMAGLLVLALSACGRRGQPEAPPDPSVPAAQRNAVQQGATVATPNAPAGGGPSGAAASDDDDDETETFVPRATPTPAKRGAKRGYVIPKEPFILDPLL
jgi:predicted small lipoprotein YifL